MADREPFGDIRRVLDEPCPTSQDADEWAAWCDRKVTAAELLRDEAHLAGDLEGAATADRLAEVARLSARRLREFGGGA